MIKREYYRSGQLWNETPYHEGQRHGIAKEYYRSGELLFETPYYEGQQHGISKHWNKNRKLCCKYHYLYNDKVTEEEYRRHELIEILSGLTRE